MRTRRALELYSKVSDFWMFPPTDPRNPVQTGYGGAAAGSHESADASHDRRRQGIHRSIDPSGRDPRGVSDGHNLHQRPGDGTRRRVRACTSHRGDVVLLATVVVSAMLIALCYVGRLQAALAGEAGRPTSA